MKGRRLAILTGLLALAVVAIAAWVGWPHLRFWYLFESLGTNAQGYPEYRHRQTGIVMVRLPGGKFWMGAQNTDPNGRNYDPEAEDNEAPVHEVSLRPFLIGKYEVTQKQYHSITGNDLNRHDLPAWIQFWDSVQEFEKKTELILPTEAQWEYACRGGSKSSIAGSPNIDEMGWTGENSKEIIYPVGQKTPNGFGIHDMHGNFVEWCEDVFDPGFFHSPNAKDPDPVLTTGGANRVIRGGSVYDENRQCRCSYRRGASAKKSKEGPMGYGFRVTYSIP